MLERRDRGTLLAWVPTVLAGLSRENGAKASDGREISCEVFHCRNFVQKILWFLSHLEGRPKVNRLHTF